MICTFPDCGRTSMARNLCSGHYGQVARGDALRPLRAYGAAGRLRIPIANPKRTGTLLVPLTKGYFAIIDKRDGAEVGKYNWSVVLSPHRRTEYARGLIDGERVLLHVFLWRHWGLAEAPQIDHDNTNGLDCRRRNLRAATVSQNKRNVRKYRNNKSGYKGVSWDKRKRRWRAQILSDGRRRFLGYFPSSRAAKACYAKAAADLHGAFARTE